MNGECMLRTVPPAPHVIASLLASFRRKNEGYQTFGAYLLGKGYAESRNPPPNKDGGSIFDLASETVQPIPIPRRRVKQAVKPKVLLVDFDDRPGHTPVEHFQDLLFSKGVYLNGSLRDFYLEVSKGTVDLDGEVHNWIRLPGKYADYTDGTSGLELESYPKNGQKMAEDAVTAALAKGIQFDESLDALGSNIVNALIIVHAGTGAEKLHETIRGGEIWSHAWGLTKAINVNLPRNLWAATYLTVPEDCQLGVCAHELGHLLFQWGDFYDGDDKDGSNWFGTGMWDLMAGGSYNGNENSPAHPAALHKVQHGWLDLVQIGESASLRLKPSQGLGGKAFKIRSSRFEQDQYLLLENRSLFGFDRALPGQGLLVWRVDESQLQNSPVAPGMALIQADAEHHLENVFVGNGGDPGDPFPGSSFVHELRDVGDVSTSFPGQLRSGISLLNIRFDKDSPDILLDLVIET
jgi:immune inhibitor A